ncbi:MAG TPA: aconitate hydratase [Spirochaetota bacterium]|nr:aconitate hydratase [Spirochaetota bacterium]HOS33304.1 aconitate hydratase [Spirochaetota bacterium]HOS55762.1 aconitate hydratase [Spirochaetota bacterium]HPK61154.1 aconitate hydratase [Spirochaetota bacterium]HQF76726.1 aconitate hydratase [Spirochaetota bacterium]
MGKSVAQKILEIHIVEGEYKYGSEIGIKIDQTLTQDATGTLAYLQFEAMNVPKVQTEISVSYVDHNTLQTDNRNMDDHLYLQSVASKYGIYYSRPGNGICHQVHLERFARPGYTLLGSDSHTPTSGGIGMIAIGSGGLDVACAMAGEPFFLKVPKVINIKLTGKLKPWASAKDIILRILKIKSVKGGVGAIIEYSGDGLKNLSVPERAVITNMGAELGATTSIFPSDEITLDFMKRQGREHQFVEIKADEDAIYDETIEIDLSSIVTYAAAPHSPDNVKKISDLSAVKVNQVSIGSCTNSSYRDLWIVGKILEGKVIAKNVSLTISPGSKQVFSMISRDGTLTRLIDAGARILECACGPCIGMGQSPNSAGVSLRTFNRNFEGRSGTKDAEIYLVSPEVAAISALNGFISDPMEHLGIMPEFKFPDEFVIDDRFIIPPAIEPDKVQIIRGPGIKPLPEQKPLPDSIEAKVIIKVGDNITTDHILPAGAKVLPYRSDIPKISEFAFGSIDPEFYKKALKEKTGVIVGGENYGQGSSREHAALAPKYLGIAVVIAKSFARIHKANLINFGIVPMTFENPGDYDSIKETDLVKISSIKSDIQGSKKCEAYINDKKIILNVDLSERDIQILLDGGTLANIKNKFSKKS